MLILNRARPHYTTEAGDHVGGPAATICGLFRGDWGPILSLPGKIDRRIGGRRCSN
jgi:hypothetical protein